VVVNLERPGLSTRPFSFARTLAFAQRVSVIFAEALEPGLR
jgi:hypothetical protein